MYTQNAHLHKTFQTIETYSQRYRDESLIDSNSNPRSSPASLSHSSPLHQPLESSLLQSNHTANIARPDRPLSTALGIRASSSVSCTVTADTTSAVFECIRIRMAETRRCCGRRSRRARITERIVVVILTIVSRARHARVHSQRSLL